MLTNGCEHSEQTASPPNTLVNVAADDRHHFVSYGAFSLCSKTEWPSQLACMSWPLEIFVTFQYSCSRVPLGLKRQCREIC
jgi:hypothetical protein